MNVRITKPTRYVVKSKITGSILGIFDSPEEVAQVTGERYTKGRLLTMKWDITEVETDMSFSVQ